MSDEILLYLVLFGMLMLAIGMLMSLLLRIGCSIDMRAEEDEAYGEAVIDAFRRQQAALDEERRTGAITKRVGGTEATTCLAVARRARCGFS